MNFRLILGFAVLSSMTGLLAAGLPKEEAPKLETAAESLEELIAKLGDESYKVREDATLKLWKAGEAALPELKACAEGGDPEKAHRASELIWKIELSITPETAPSVLKWVEGYPKSQPNEKIKTLNQLVRVKAWRQILKLYASEDAPEVRERFQTTAQRVAILAARECLLEKDPQSARRFLEMAPATQAGLMALADFHRSQGTSEEELARAKADMGDQSPAWELALQRAKGDLEASREAADAAGEGRISALLTALAGDPLPWMRADLAKETDSGIRRAYGTSVIRRWEGKEVQVADLELLKRAAVSQNESAQTLAIDSLFLLGENRAAEEATAKQSPFNAFTYFESLERVDEALQILRLDVNGPQLAEWVKKRFDHLSEDAADDDQDATAVDVQLITMANFLERRGFQKQAIEVFASPLENLAKADEERYLNFLGDLSGVQRSVAGAPLLVKKFASDWAKDDEARWLLVVQKVFANHDSPESWWEWMIEMQPTSAAAERFEGLLALFEAISDPSEFRKQWLARAWKDLEKAPEAKKSTYLALLSYLANDVAPGGTDAALALKVWASFAEGKQPEDNWGRHVYNLSTVERWDEAAEFFLRQIANAAEVKQEPQPISYAFAAACLRLADRIEEADVYDSWVDQLALGSSDTALQIGKAYAFGRQMEKARQWWLRAAILMDPDTDEFSGTGQFLECLQLVSDGLLEEGKWKQAAAINELLALHFSAPERMGAAPVALMRLRMQADMARALSMLEENRDEAFILLENCHSLFPSEGSLADTFFPALRKAGLLELHDRLFDITWKLITTSIQNYPASENTYNTAAWLASRAQRNLGPAQKLLEKALEMNPNQAAYLDTMAEIHFAKGNRPKALKWSNLAINYSPQDSMIRRQHERFLNAPLPR